MTVVDADQGKKGGQQHKGVAQRGFQPDQKHGQQQYCANQAGLSPAGAPLTRLHKLTEQQQGENLGGFGGLQHQRAELQPAPRAAYLLAEKQHRHKTQEAAGISQPNKVSPGCALVVPVAEQLEKRGAQQQEDYLPLPVGAHRIVVAYVAAAVDIKKPEEGKRQQRKPKQELAERKFVANGGIHAGAGG